MAPDRLGQLAEAYARFAEHEARGRSALYERLANDVARDRVVLGLLAELPASRQQPNLLFAAVRHVCGVPSGGPQLRAWVLERRDEIVGVMLARGTQTNEPARCATLLPLLAALPQPLALLEVGASAGLCLLPDRYAYDFGRRRIAPTRPVAAVDPPTLVCRASAGTPLPGRGVDVAWRAGLDLDPVDVHDAEQVAWLEALVWPDERDRLERLRAAIAVARADPPPLTRGDLRTDLPRLAAQAPPDATLVVLHTAVLAYVPDAQDRAAFARTVRDVGAVWVANEAPGIAAAPPTAAPPEDLVGPFLLTRDGEPVAWTDPHGAGVQWLARPTPARRSDRGRPSG